MLKLELAEDLLNELHEMALERHYGGTMEGFWMMAVRGAIENMIWSFNKDQARMGERALPDGGAANLRAALAGDRGIYAFPKTSGRFLQGLKLRFRQAIPAQGPESYLCELTVGPAEMRQHGRHTCLFVYIHPWQTGYVAWIGPNESVGDGIAFLSSRTSQFRDFSCL